MPICHSDFIEFSDSELEDKLATEFKIRNASSRAYYALYHKALNVILVKKLNLLKVKSGGSHASLIETIRSIESPKAKSIADAMNNLKRFRHNCDYDLSMTINREIAEKHIAGVKRIISMLDRV